MLAHNANKVITPISGVRVDFCDARHKNHTFIVNIVFKTKPHPAPVLACKPLPPWSELIDTFVISLNF
jgi:hypothetical protein